MTQPTNTDYKSIEEQEREEFLHLLHQVVQHTPLKLSETSGTEYDKGYIFYQDMVLRDVEELETTMWEWHQKKVQERDAIARQEERKDNIGRIALFGALLLKEGITGSEKEKLKKLMHTALTNPNDKE